MRIPVVKPYTLAELKPLLEERFPDYAITFRGSRVLVIGNGKIAGATINGERKKNIRIFQAFPTVGGQGLFTLSILFFGVFIPFIVYYAALRPKQVKLRNEVAEFLREQYGTGALNSSSDILDDKI